MAFGSPDFNRIPDGIKELEVDRIARLDVSVSHGRQLQHWLVIRCLVAGSVLTQYSVGLYERQKIRFSVDHRRTSTMLTKNKKHQVQAQVQHFFVLISCATDQQYG